MSEIKQPVIIWEKGHLSLDTILLYNKGKLSPLDMHKVERHLLNCELCTDATEGFSGISGKQDVHKIVEELKLRIGQQVIPETAEQKNKTFRYLGIAASIIILLSITYIFIDRNAPADVEEPEVLAFQSKKSEDKSDLGSTKEIEEIPEDLPEIIETPEEEQTMQLQPTEESTPQPLQIQPLASQKSLLGAGTTTLPDETSTDLAVSDLVSASVPSPVASDDTQEMAFGDQTGQEDLAFAVEAEEEPLDVSMKSTGIVEREIKTELASVEKISDNESLETPARARSAQVVDLSGKAIGGAKKARKNMNMDPEPAVGFDAYEVYLREYVRYPEEAGLNNIKGTVVVEFAVKEGSAYSNFKIIQGLGYGCDKEAQRLIKEGPNWNAAIRNGEVVKEKVRVSVEF